MSYLQFDNSVRVPRGRAPRSRSSGIVVGCPGEVPGTSAEGSGVTARRERTTACRAHRDLRRKGDILTRDGEASGIRVAGGNRGGQVRKMDLGSDP